jgi:small subunit ribosomal protein S12
VVYAKVFNKFINSGQCIKIPGEKHNLQLHSTILINYNRCNDLIGVSLKAIRGKYDLGGVSGRMNARSVYGVKKVR